MIKNRFFPLLLTLLLGACTVTFVPDGSVAVNARVRFGIELNNIIDIFEPTRGSGAIYSLNENISFRLRANQSGYITLTAIDPDGTVYPIIRNVFVRAGETRIIPNSSDGVAFTLAPPRGLHRVRASFTPSATDITRVRYTGVITEDRWTNTIVTEVRPYQVRDIVQTRFFIE